jgi:lauroyl/myristoyl acyltransferase
VHFLSVVCYEIDSALKNEIDYPKRIGTFSTIKPKYLNQMINIFREEQKIACLKRTDQLHYGCDKLLNRLSQASNHYVNRFQSLRAQKKNCVPQAISFFSV